MPICLFVQVFEVRMCHFFIILLPLLTRVYKTDCSGKEDKLKGGFHINHLFDAERYSKSVENFKNTCFYGIQKQTNYCFMIIN